MPQGVLGTSALLVLDARDVARGPLARVLLAPPATTTTATRASNDDVAPMFGPGHGLHATFVPDLVPTLEAVHAAERGRRERGACFIGDGDVDGDAE